MTWLKFQYFLVVFGTSCGLLQVVFTYRGFRGLQFFLRRPLNYAVGATLAVGTLAWFYLSGDRNVPPVLEGSEQTIAFLEASSCAVLFCIIVGSAARRTRLASGRCGAGQRWESGLDELRCDSYLRCLPRIAGDIRGVVSCFARWLRNARSR